MWTEYVIWARVSIRTQRGCHCSVMAHRPLTGGRRSEAEIGSRHSKYIVLHYPQAASPPGRPDSALTSNPTTKFSRPASRRKGIPMHRRSPQTWAAALLLVAFVLPLVLAAAPQAAQAGSAPAARPPSPEAHLPEAVAFDVSQPLRDLRRPVTALQGRAQAAPAPDQEPIEIRPERRPAAVDTGYAGDGALQSGAPRPRTGRARQAAAPQAAAIPAPQRQLRRASATRTTSTSSASASTRPIRSATSAPTTTSRWSTWPSPSTTSRATCCSARSTSARCGPASPSPTAPTPRATRSCSTTSSRIAGC